MVNKKPDITNFIRWMITITVMIVTVIEILDMTIVNVALPPMMSSLGANSDQITWVLTSYIVAAAIVMPLTGFLVDRFGRKKLLLCNIVGFLLSSMLCGMSVNLSQIVFFRILQGVFGAALVPLSQYILMDIFPKKDQGKAMAIWGIGVMVAPVIGPTLGGYITEAMNWRWVFYINIPVCILAFFMALQFIPETKTKKQRIDWYGLLLLAVGIGALQVFLDRGNVSDWFSSKSIVLLCITWVFVISAFILRGIRIKEKNIINLHLFKNRNFMAATIMLAIFCMGMFGVVGLMPLMLEHLMGYTAAWAGLMIAPRAMASAIGMPLAALLIRRFPSKYVILAGVIISAIGSYMMCSYNLEISFHEMAIANMVTGFGNGLFFVPLSTLALSTLSNKDSAEGAGLYNFGRNLGGSIGISVMSTLISREWQTNWNRLGGHVTMTNPIVHHWLQVKHMFAHSSLTIATLTNEVSRHSLMIAFIDSYWLTTISLLCMIPLVFLIKNK